MTKYRFDQGIYCLIIQDPLAWGHPWTEKGRRGPTRLAPGELRQWLQPEGRSAGVAADCIQVHLRAWGEGLSGKQDFIRAVETAERGWGRNWNFEAIYHRLEAENRGLHPREGWQHRQATCRVHQQLPWKIKVEDHVHEGIGRRLLIRHEESSC